MDGIARTLPYVRYRPYGTVRTVPHVCYHTYGTVRMVPYGRYSAYVTVRWVPCVYKWYRPYGTYTNIRYCVHFRKTCNLSFVFTECYRVWLSCAVEMTWIQKLILPAIIILYNFWLSHSFALNVTRFFSAVSPSQRCRTPKHEGNDNGSSDFIPLFNPFNLDFFSKISITSYAVIGTERVGY